MLNSIRDVNTIKVLVNGEDITHYTNDLTYEGDDTKFNRSVKFSLQYSHDLINPLVMLDVGFNLQLYYRDNLLFSGVIFHVDYNSEGTMSVTAYDPAIYLAKNNIQRVVKNTTASQLIINLCKEFNIPVGDIASTGYVIPILNLDNKTISYSIGQALAITYKQTGRMYHLRMGTNGVNLSKVDTDLSKRIRITEGGFLQGVSKSRSIEGIINSVEVIGGTKEKQIKYTKEDTNSIKLYGKFHSKEKLDEKTEQSHVKQKADEMIKQNSKPQESLSINAIGNIDVTTGIKVFVYETLTKTSYTYYVQSDTHTFDSSGKHSMQLKLVLDPVGSHKDSIDEHKEEKEEG